MNIATRIGVNRLIKRIGNNTRIIIGNNTRIIIGNNTRIIRTFTQTPKHDYFKDKLGNAWSDYYQNVLQNDENGNRFQSIKNRSDDSSLDIETISNVQLSKKNNSFKNTVLLKDPFDESILKQLLFEIKPRTIFEFGTFTGSSASYIKMILNEFELNESKILTFDIKEEFRNKEIDDKRGFIEYVVCDLNVSDLNNIEQLSKNKLLNEYEHPWLIIDDAHCDIYHLLNHFDENGMKKGDYIIIEDTLHPLQTIWEENIAENKPKNKKLVGLRAWLIENENKGYLVDSKYCDLWGYNATWNVNGYITKNK
eukprot:179977_1